MLKNHSGSPEFLCPLPKIPKIQSIYLMVLWGVLGDLVIVGDLKEMGRLSKGLSQGPSKGLSLGFSLRGIRGGPRGRPSVIE